MNQRVLFITFFGLLLAACKTRKKEPVDNDSGYFPVLSYLQSQVRQVDTGLYSITKISKAHNAVDTQYLRREEFRTAAQDFISLPDIASGDLKQKYNETKLYDEDLKKVVITYEPKNKNDFEQVTREDVIIEPGNAATDQVQSIYIETVSANSDSTVQKKMTWNVNQNFQIIKLIDKTGQEDVQTTDVRWWNGH